MESESSWYMTCLLKLDAHLPGWERSLNKVLKSIQGVKFTIDQPRGLVCVSGKIEPEIILKKLKKAGKRAELLWVDYGRNRNPEIALKNHRDGVIDSYSRPYYQPESINCPYILSYYQYYPQHWGQPPHYYPPPPPPPCKPLPSGPSYEYHRHEPVARNFPQPPPPPPNYVVGDLQCRIL